MFLHLNPFLYARFIKWGAQKTKKHEFPSWTCHVSEYFGASLTISRTTWFPPHRSTSALWNRSICSLPASLGWENLQETNAEECQIRGCPPVCSNISGSEIPINGALNGKFIFFFWIVFVNHIPFPTCFSQRTSMKNPWCPGAMGRSGQGATWKILLDC